MDSYRGRMLMVAFHFPPCVGSSGLLRTLCFSRDLVALSWNIDVLSASPGIYEHTSEELTSTIPPHVNVHRARGFDTRRKLSINGRYPGVLALPDRYVSWYFDAVRQGLDLIRRKKVDVIWTTYPVATSHLIGWTLARLTGKPWIADFRDPMVEFDSREGVWYPVNSNERRVRLWVERLVDGHASAVVFCTNAARELYVGRYGMEFSNRSYVIPNGYDEATFSEIEKAEPPVDIGDRITLLHSGTIYPSPDRDPSPFFAALKSLRDRGLFVSGRDRVILRATGCDDWLAPILERECVEDIVFLEPRCSYQDALREMMMASGLLVFQGHTSNPAVPAKLYEYFRAGRPVMGLVDSKGETAALLRLTGVDTLADIVSVEEISAVLAQFLVALRSGDLHGVDRRLAISYSREHRAQELSDVAEHLVRRSRGLESRIEEGA